MEAPDACRRAIVWAHAHPDGTGEVPEQARAVQAGTSFAGRGRGGPVSTRRPRRDAVTCAADCAAVAALAALALWTGGWGGVAWWLLAVVWAAVLIPQIRMISESRRIRRP